MSSSQVRHKRDVDEAYEIQAKAGITGAARSTAVGIGLAVIVHHLSPAFRRQTLAFKGFIVSGFTIFGLVHGAEKALFEHENRKRREENILRREARLDLARRGLIGTETEIANWKAEKELERSRPS
ncbi:hypothetical protein BDN70DRAFT_873128 [Pholiota conissans]|uniref:Uncharacterized protein n=1 Tax=Pholiota conissans TaxID=109636 RepID=A0A9P5ZCJ0_9AGAR|nr:hypothetical protein BDN70DRAFT_873128 [Pholiota conissans]